jgi:hypothetical protein
MLIILGFLASTYKILKRLAFLEFVKKERLYCRYTLHALLEKWDNLRYIREKVESLSKVYLLSDLKV